MLSSRHSSVYSPAYGKNSSLLKKIPSNPRYQHVKPVIDSGFNVRKYLEALQESQKNINYKKDECFKRIKLSAFVKLVIEVFNEVSDDEFPKLEDIDEIKSTELLNVEDAAAGGDLKSTKSVPLSDAAFSSVVVGVGEMDIQDGIKKGPPAPPQDFLHALPYLLLDVRDRDDFRACNIISAKSYPYPMLSRAYSYETKDLLKYKNVPHKLIIVYDEDESLASRVASTLVQRGYDNIYMLSGGLRLATEKFPKGLVNGNLPLRQTVSKSGDARSARSPEYHVSPQHPVSSSHVSKQFFSQDDIALLQEYLDKYITSLGCRMESLSRSCSRMSRAESALSAAVSRSRAGVKSAPSKSRPPWK